MRRGKSNLYRYRTLFLLATITLIASLHLFGYLAAEMLEEEVTLFDQKVTGWVKELIPASLTPAMLWLSFFASTVPVTALTLVLALFLWRRKSYGEAAVIVAAPLGAFLLEELFKALFRRPRPELAPLTRAHGYSFPSGHATVAAALAVVLAWLWYCRTRGKLWQWVGPLFTFLLAFLIGVSRIYLGAHYPSDVLAGFALGIAWGIALILGRETPRLPGAGGAF